MKPLSFYIRLHIDNQKFPISSFIEADLTPIVNLWAQKQLFGDHILFIFY